MTSLFDQMQGASTLGESQGNFPGYGATFDNAKASIGSRLPSGQTLADGFASAQTGFEMAKNMPVGANSFPPEVLNSASMSGFNTFAASTGAQIPQAGTVSDLFAGSGLTNGSSGSADFPGFASTTGFLKTDFMPGEGGGIPNIAGGLPSLGGVGDAFGTGISSLGKGVGGIASTVFGKASTAMSGMAGNAMGLLNSSAARLGVSGLLPGGGIAGLTGDTQIGFSGSNPSISPDADWRVRVSVSPTSGVLYKATDPGIMAPLINSSGVIFPYTPNITFTHNNIYTAQAPTHSNYPIQSYQHSEIAAITIQGDFTVQSVEEGQYLLAVIHFFRGAAKMFYGKDTLAGNPPVVLFLNGYGAHYLPNVPCVLTSFAHTMPADVDYMDVPITTTSFQDIETTSTTDGLNGGTDFAESRKYMPAGFSRGAGVKSVTRKYTTSSVSTRLPTLSQITLTLMPVYSRNAIHNTYSTEALARGDFINSNKGGFI